MSPPPRHEAEDYWNSHASHGHKKRRLGASGLSPSGDIGRNLQASTTEPPEESVREITTSIKRQGQGQNTSSTISKLFTATDKPQPYGSLAPRAGPLQLGSQAQLKNSSQSSTALVEEGGESPAVTSLRRLSIVGVRRPSNALNADESSNLFSSSIEALLGTSETTSQSPKQPTGDQANWGSNARRRSSAFRDGDRRRPKKDDGKAAVSGLVIPATITLRKATGLFGVGAGPASTTDTHTKKAAVSKDESISSLTTCSLIAFDSQQLDDQKQAKGPRIEARSRKNLIVATKGLEFLVPTPPSTASSTMGGLYQGPATPALAITNIYPSPAMLASPIKASSPTGSPERRFSVVQIHSRKSVHRVLWCEDEISDSSGTLSDPVSPTEGTIAGSVMLPSPSVDSPVASEAGSRRDSKTTLYEGQSFAPDLLVDNENDTPTGPAGSRTEGGMFQWSWGAEIRTPETDGISAAGPVHSANEQQGQSPEDSPEDSPPAKASSVPQLMIPNEEESSAPSHGPATVRRGSFLMDPSRHASIGPGREIGSRRSISINPLALSRFANYEASNMFNSSPGARRPSRIA